VTAYSALVLYPSPVKAGDRLRVIAPSGPFDRTLFFRGLAWLGRRYQLIWSRGSLERTGYLAGTDQRRLDELNEALRDPEARALVAARGGYGATRICHEADFSSLTRYPKWCVGFSDFTTVHLEAASVGVGSIHAPNLTALGRADEGTRNDWIHAVEQPFARRCFPELFVLAAGEARGRLIGGNLTLLFAAAAAGRLRLPDGCLLFIEEINEAPYRIDRMLTALMVSGKLSKVAGVCVGDLTDSSREIDHEQAIAVVGERLGRLGVPILSGLPVGHGLVNRALPLGAPALLSSHRSALIINPTPADAE
jgi:muramoyltetrapeptide carboxypeptidase